MLAAGEGGEHGERIRKRDPYRLVYRTKDFPKDLREWQAENEKLEAVEKELGTLIEAKEQPKNRWYTSNESADIPVTNDNDPSDVRPLSEYSHLLRQFAAQSPTLLYVEPGNAYLARDKVKKIVKIESIDVATEEPVLKQGPLRASTTPVEGGSTNAS